FQAAGMTGADEEDVPLLDSYSLLALGCFEVLREDALSGLEPGCPALARDIQQDAAADETVFRKVDRLGGGPGERDRVRPEAVVEAISVCDVAERVDVGVAVVVVIDPHVVLGEAHRA